MWRGTPGRKHVRMKLESAGGEICSAIAGRRPRPRGAAARPTGRGMGMIGMRARARSAGGDVAVRSPPGRGCSN